MNVEAMHGLAVIIIPIIVIGLLKRSTITAAVATVFYLFVAFYLLNRIDEAVSFWISGAYTGSLISMVVLASIYFYNVYKYLGYERRIAGLLKEKREVQLSLATFFAGFIEGVSGFGIPVAVVAPLLYAMGVPAVVAVSSVMVGHTWAVPFASMGVPTAVLATLTETDVFELSTLTGIYMSFSLAVVVVVISRLLKTPVIRTIIYALMSFLVYPIAIALGPITGSVAGITLFTISTIEALGFSDTLKVLSELKPYLFLTIVLMTASFLGFRGLEVASFLIALSGVIVQLVSKRIGKEPVVNAVRMAWKPFLAITLFASAAEMAGKGGFMYSLAQVIASSVGIYYFYAVPLIGALGAYFTGSNTTSNIVFAKLQEGYAEFIGVNKPQLLALQNTGGGIGSMSSPSKIAVGASTTEGEEIESDVFRTVVKILPFVLLPQVIIAMLIPLR